MALGEEGVANSERMEHFKPGVIVFIAILGVMRSDWFSINLIHIWEISQLRKFSLPPNCPVDKTGEFS